MTTSPRLIEPNKKAQKVKSSGINMIFKSKRKENKKTIKREDKREKRKNGPRE
jgi:hypothetical protein